MTDKTEFSLEIAVEPARGFRPLPDLVAFDLCKAYPVGGDKLLLHNTRNGKRSMVTAEVYAALLKCAAFKTLEAHTTAIIDGNPGMGGQRTDVRKVLQAMLDAGMMLSGKEVCERLRHEAAAAPRGQPDPEPVVAILTWERPQALGRLLASIAANCNAGRFHCLYVIDDSRDPQSIRDNRELVAKFAPAMGAPLQYFGREQQQVLLRELAKRVPEHTGAIHFLADPDRWRDCWTSGMARNLALLLSCGRRLLMIDDDAICELHAPPQARPEVTFSDGPRETDFFAGEQEWASWRSPHNPDPLDAHLQSLGLSFAAALEALGVARMKAPGLDGATALLAGELHGASPVLLTECGSLGCPGSADNTWLPNMEPASLEKMLASAQKTDNALHSRLVWSGRSRPHFAPRSNMSQITGFDNRQMLPPYLPIERGGDRLFGHTLDFVFPESVVLDHAWAVPHLPVPPRQWRPSDLDFSRRRYFPSFFAGKVLEQKSACLASGAENRLSALAGWVDELAAASPATLRAMYRDARLRGASQNLQHLAALATSAAAAPAAWRDYLGAGMQQLNATLDAASREDFPVHGSSPARQGDELIAFWKDVWAGFAAALRAWPEIRRAAADLAADTARRPGGPARS